MDTKQPISYTVKSYFATCQGCGASFGLSNSFALRCSVPSLVSLIETRCPECDSNHIMVTAEYRVELDSIDGIGDFNPITPVPANARLCES